MNTFLQLEAEKKDSNNGAARKSFDPSYFMMALVIDKLRLIMVYVFIDKGLKSSILTYTYLYFHSIV